MLVFSGYLAAQQTVSLSSFKVVADTACKCSDDKKVLKKLEEGKDRKAEKEERVGALREAIELDPDCAEAHYLLGLELLRSAISRGASYKSAESELAECIRICADFHFEPYYYLGALALGRKDYGQAVKYYEKYFALSGASTEILDDKREGEIKLDYEYAQFFYKAYNNPVPFAPEKVASVCTSDDEFLPIISPDNEKMLLTRRYSLDSEVKASLMTGPSTYTEKFVEAKRINGNQFEKGEPFPMPFNESDAYKYGGATVSLDYKQIYLTICKPASMGYTNCDIYTSKRVYGTQPASGAEGYYWTPLENLGSNINTENGFESQPSISADGKTLYFVSDRGENRGLEIYYSEQNAQGQWQEAKNMGEPINTPFNDKTPFMHSDSRTLYFASDGHLGLGGLDVFYTKQNEDGTWQKPVNLGYPINSEGDEQAFAVSTDGRKVYYSAKDRNNPQSIDIWSFDLYKEARPDQVVFVKGTLKTEEGNPPKDTRIQLKTMDSKNISEVEVNEDDGSYAAVVRVQEQEAVVLNVSSEEIAFQSKLIEPAATDEKKTRVHAEEAEEAYQAMQEVNFEVAEVKEGGVYRINDIYYATNSAEISEKSKLVLREFADYLKAHPSMRIAIHGHTDNVGNDAANLALSADRAFSVKRFLEESGVKGDRIAYKGFGETVPFTSNDTPEGRAKNRRTEFLILAK